jgi:plasmid stability protein
MPGLLIKDLPKRLHSRLKRRASLHRRSLSAEAILLLEQALEDRAGPPSLAEIDQLRITGVHRLTQEIIDAARENGRP